MDIASRLAEEFPSLETIAWNALAERPMLRERLTASCYPGEMPSAIVYPATQAELSAVMKLAFHNDWQVIPFGRGSKLHWGGLVRGAELAVSTEKLDRIIEYATDDFTLTVEAGVTLDAIEALLAPQNQQLAIDPTFPGEATIGGVVATADTGSLRQRYGGVRDRVIGIQFVRHDGEIAKAGGRVVKNVAGYDLMKLLTGSFGTLGTIAQMTFRLYPIPEASQTIVIRGEPDNVDRFSRAVLASSLTPVAFDLIGPSLVKSLYLGTGLGVALKFATVEASLTSQTQRVLELADQCGVRATIYEPDEALEYWQRSRDRLDRPQNGENCTVKFGTRPTAAIESLLTFDRLFKTDGAAIVHYRSGLGRAAIARDRGGSRLLSWRRFCEDNGGFLTVLAAPLALRRSATAGTFDLWGARDSAKATMTQIADRFDPARRHNPGRFLI